MIEQPTPCITVSVDPGHRVLAASRTFLDMVGRRIREEDEIHCYDLLSCGGVNVPPGTFTGSDLCQAEGCPLVRVYRCEEKFLGNVPVHVRENGNLVPTTAQFCALWEPWGSYVSVWFGAEDAYE